MNRGFQPLTIIILFQVNDATDTVFGGRKTSYVQNNSKIQLSGKSDCIKRSKTEI